MPTERFQFTGEGGHQLAAALDTPDGPVQAYALFAHCFTCGKDVLAAKRIATALAAKGIAVCLGDRAAMEIPIGESGAVGQQIFKGNRAFCRIRFVERTVGRTQYAHV